MDTPNRPDFPATRWSIIDRTASPSEKEAADALNYLAETYWPPLYIFARCSGQSPHDAEDVVQAVLAKILSDTFPPPSLTTGHPPKFRSYLLAAVKYHMIDLHRRKDTIVRGKHFTHISIDAEYAESLYNQLPDPSPTPDDAFERSYANSLLASALDQLRTEYHTAGKAALFDALSPFLGLDTKLENRAAIAADLEISEGALSVALTRLRSRFTTTARETVAHTLTDPAELDGEIAYILGLFSR